ncbi:MAG: hypothetical protein ACI9BW_003678, partial [Gammaproteobacteria bacterium]
NWPSVQLRIVWATREFGSSAIGEKFACIQSPAAISDKTGASQRLYFVAAHQITYCLQRQFRIKLERRKGCTL